MSNRARWTMVIVALMATASALLAFFQPGLFAPQTYETLRVIISPLGGLVTWGCAWTCVAVTCWIAVIKGSAAWARAGMILEAVMWGIIFMIITTSWTILGSQIGPHLLVAIGGMIGILLMLARIPQQTPLEDPQVPVRKFWERRRRLP